MYFKSIFYCIKLKSGFYCVSVVPLCYNLTNKQNPLFSCTIVATTWLKNIVWIVLTPSSRGRIKSYRLLYKNRLLQFITNPRRSQSHNHNMGKIARKTFRGSALHLSPNALSRHYHSGHTNFCYTEEERQM